MKIGRVYLPKLDFFTGLGLVVTLTMLLAALVGPLLTQLDPAEIVGSPYMPPGELLLGTDILGRDVWSRLLYGARLTVFIAFCATSVAFIIGVRIPISTGHHSDN